MINPHGFDMFHHDVLTMCKWFARRGWTSTARPCSPTSSRRPSMVRVEPASRAWLEALLVGDDTFTERFGIGVVEGWTAEFTGIAKWALERLDAGAEPAWGIHLFFDDDVDGALVQRRLEGPAGRRPRSWAGPCPSHAGAVASRRRSCGSSSTRRASAV